MANTAQFRAEMFRSKPFNYRTVNLASAMATAIDDASKRPEVAQAYAQGLIPLVFVELDPHPTRMHARIIIIAQTEAELFHGLPLHIGVMIRRRWSELGTKRALVVNMISFDLGLPITWYIRKDAGGKKFVKPDYEMVGMTVDLSARPVVSR